jgi:hypothetical protein
VTDATTEVPRPPYSSGVRDGAIWLVIGALATACGGGGDVRSDGTLPLADHRDPTTDTGPSSDLAPSQLTAETVAPPPTPGPCAVDDLELWTAQVVLGPATADAVVRVRNTGDEWCEPDISGSSPIDPAIEPDVWLDPGGWADLVVGQSGNTCDEPTAVTAVPIDVDGNEVLAPAAAVVTCGWLLVAFYPIEPAERPCEPSQLDVAVVEHAVVVRNSSFESCVLGELVAVGGAGVSSEPRADDTAPAIIDLAGGDVVAFPRRPDATVECDGDATPGVLAFEVAGDVDVSDLGCGTLLAVGPGRPFFGDASLSTFGAGELDVAVAITALDPFGS